MDVNQPDDEMRFMVCLYDIALDKADIVPLMGEIDQLLRAMEQHPTHFSIRAPGFGRKPLRFDRVFKRLQKTEPDALRTVGLYCLTEDWNTKSNWIATSSVRTRYAYFDLGTSLTTVPDAEQRIMGFVERWLDRMRPGYGIGFYRARDYGPDFYGIGLSFGPGPSYDGPELAESLAVNRWSAGMDEAVWARGVLRDVYPYHLLTARHLERDVTPGVPLGEWIRAAPWRGQLSGPCHDGYSLWTVDMAHLAEVRRVLACAGALHVLPRDNHLCHEHDS